MQDPGGVNHPKISRVAHVRILSFQDNFVPLRVHLLKLKTGKLNPGGPGTTHR